MEPRLSPEQEADLEALIGIVIDRLVSLGIAAPSLAFTPEQEARIQAIVRAEIAQWHLAQLAVRRAESAALIDEITRRAAHTDALCGVRSSGL